MKKRNIVLVIILCISVMLLVSCDKKKPVHKVEMVSGDYVLEHYTETFPNFNSMFAEIYYNTMEGGLFPSIGPTEPGYRMVAFLTDEASNQLLDDYEWTKVENPELTFEQLETPQDRDWYECEQFTKDKFKLVHINYVYFDGVDTIVFDVHTY